jgi:hypothetical protein
MSRNTSSRINADQDWGITGPDGQLLPQAMQSGGGAGFAAHAGMPLHVPGPSSRRTSRTLSGECSTVKWLFPHQTAHAFCNQCVYFAACATFACLLFRVGALIQAVTEADAPPAHLIYASGRLPPDQDGAAVVAQLGDAEPDVLARPVTATSMALDTIVSRRTSTNGRPGTPDSDGFGYSEVRQLRLNLSRDSALEQCQVLSMLCGLGCAGLG